MAIHLHRTWKHLLLLPVRSGSYIGAESFDQTEWETMAVLGIGVGRAQRGERGREATTKENCFASLKLFEWFEAMQSETAINSLGIA